MMVSMTAVTSEWSHTYSTCVVWQKKKKRSSSAKESLRETDKGEQRGIALKRRKAQEEGAAK